MSLREDYADLTNTSERDKKPRCLGQCKPGDLVDLQGVKVLVSRPSTKGQKVWIRRILPDGREGEIEFRDPDLPVVSIRLRP